MCTKNGRIQVFETRSLRPSRNPHLSQHFGMGISLNINYKSAFLLGLIQHTRCKGVYIPQDSKKCLIVGSFLAMALAELWYFSKHCTLTIGNVRRQMVKFITLFL